MTLDNPAPVPILMLRPPEAGGGVGPPPPPGPGIGVGLPPPPHGLDRERERDRERDRDRDVVMRDRDNRDRELERQARRERRREEDMRVLREREVLASGGQHPGDARYAEAYGRERAGYPHRERERDRGERGDRERDERREMQREREALRELASGGGSSGSRHRDRERERDREVLGLAPPPLPPSGVVDPLLAHQDPYAAHPLPPHGHSHPHSHMHPSQLHPHQHPHAHPHQQPPAHHGPPNGYAAYGGPFTSEPARSAYDPARAAAAAAAAGGAGGGPALNAFGEPVHPHGPPHGRTSFEGAAPVEPRRRGGDPGVMDAHNHSGNGNGNGVVVAGTQHDPRHYGRQPPNHGHAYAPGPAAGMAPPPIPAEVRHMGTFVWPKHPFPVTEGMLFHLCAPSPTSTKTTSPNDPNSRPRTASPPSWIDLRATIVYPARTLPDLRGQPYHVYHSRLPKHAKPKPHPDGTADRDPRKAPPVVAQAPGRGKVYGSGIYTDDSDILLAAVHSGKLNWVDVERAYFSPSKFKGVEIEVRVRGTQVDFGLEYDLGMGHIGPVGMEFGLGGRFVGSKGSGGVASAAWGPGHDGGAVEILGSKIIEVSQIVASASTRDH